MATAADRSHAELLDVQQQLACRTSSTVTHAVQLAIATDVLVQWAKHDGTAKPTVDATRTQPERDAGSTAQHFQLTRVSATHAEPNRTKHAIANASQYDTGRH